MIKLSIVIVNYNVKYFLEQCLISVFKACQNIQHEVFVVDNNSVDGSCAMIKEKFPQVRLIENKINYGFSVANNQAIKQASGQYILLLNPDTVVEENSFDKCLSFMDSNPEAGGLSVKMIDGKGRFLPESKRALPTPKVAFYKIVGLSKLFPTSKHFGRYYLGHLDKNQTHEIEILPGAFMFLRKETIDKTGLLDESFFMYGEDIDLSYRITLAGYKNYYIPETTIIHYKGESTKKGSINYVLIFYQAMVIFARKHFSQKNATLFSVVINLAIYFRAMVALAHRFIKKAMLPVLDFLSIYLGYYFLIPIWEDYKFHSVDYYPPEFILMVVPAYILIWMISLWFNGCYARTMQKTSALKGIATGLIIILLIYSLLPINLRFSRALILIGAIIALLTSYINRIFIHITGVFHQHFSIRKRLRILIIGKVDEISRVEKLLSEAQIKPGFIGYVSSEQDNSNIYLGSTNQLDEMITVHKIDEIVFCARDIASQNIIQLMLKLSSKDIDFKIAQPESISIIGSNSIDTAGDFYTLDINSISKETNIRNKRIFDIFSSLIILFISPILIVFTKKSIQLVNNSLHVLFGFKTWVGYYIGGDIQTKHLPSIKLGILTPLDYVKSSENSVSYIENLNMVYAKNYKILTDLQILIKGFKNTDRR
ncbi:MAG: glycosyltransferase [Bacteroidales bacterium]